MSVFKLKLKIKVIKELKKIISDIKENVSLSDYTSFKIGGPARFFAVVDDEDNLIKLLKFAKKEKLKYLIIGEGSNMLAADAGFDGLVIKLNFKKISFNNAEIKVSSDFILTQLVGLAVGRGFSGLEFATGIPGTVGGAVVGNAGAYGGDMSGVVEKVEVIDGDCQKIKLLKSDLKFSYRDSILKDSGFVLLNVFLNLKPGDKMKLIELMNKHAVDRSQKHPYEPSAGSTFKNIPLTDEIAKIFKKQNLGIPQKFIDYKKIPAAWLIEQAGLKGKKIGQAQISEKHANHLVNLGGAAADEVVQLISLVKTKIRDEFGIQLEEEVRYIGF